MPCKVVLDSNILLLPLNLKIDIFYEIERLLARRVRFVLIDPVRIELERLSMDRSERGRKTVYVSRLLDRCENIKFERGSRETVDDAIVRFAEGSRVIVATADTALRKRLRDINVPVIYVRERSRLKLEGYPPDDC
ncbi:MAG: type II toxin-antitoxin system VapC family toxin [Candidatus Bathyarchaeia archaeon]